VSLAELLPALRALPKADQVALLHLLIDELTGTQPTEPHRSDTPLPGEVSKLPPPGSVIDVWFPEENPEAAALQVLLPPAPPAKT
jgi:hypothetical protein